ncbi:MAG: hypothetical protein ACR2NU_09370, partial [Aeoliella sp.]
MLSKRAPFVATRIAIGTMVWWAAALGSMACRYNVRDVGFVNLGRSTYQLEVPRVGSEDAGQGDWTRLKAQYPAGNVHVVEAPANQTGEPAIISLRGPDGRQRELTIQDELDWAAEDLHRASVSELSQNLVDRLISCHSIVLLAEGIDANANKEARRVIDEAIAAVVATRSLWPKPIDNPPEVVTIPAAERGAEKSLLWSLGILEAFDKPQVAVLFGRGRRLGEVFAASEIETERLARRLSIISIDCECDFNVAAMIGPMMPHEWTEEHEARATRSLGFDPGMPLVQVEVEQ